MERFPPQNGFFPRASPPVAVYDPGIRNNPMTGDQIGDRVESDGVSRGPYCCRSAHVGRDILIAENCSAGQSEERPPDLNLKISPLDQQVKGPRRIAALESEDLRDQGSGRCPVFAQGGFGPVLSQDLKCLFPFVVGDKTQMTDATGSESEKTVAKRGGVKTVIDVNAGTHCFVFTRCHCLKGYEQIVETPRPGEPGVERGVEQTAGFLKLSFSVIEGQGMEKLGRGDARPAFEKALEIISAETRGSGDFIQAGLIPEIGFEKADRLFDALKILCFLTKVKCPHSINLTPIHSPGHPNLAMVMESKIRVVKQTRQQHHELKGVDSDRLAVIPTGIFLYGLPILIKKTEPMIKIPSFYQTP